MARRLTTFGQSSKIKKATFGSVPLTVFGVMNLRLRSGQALALLPTFRREGPMQ